MYKYAYSIDGYLLDRCVANFTVDTEQVAQELFRDDSFDFIRHELDMHGDSVIEVLTNVPLSHWVLLAGSPTNSSIE